MIKTPFFLLLFVVVFNLNIHSQIIISGQVKDKNTNKNIEFCNVTVSDKKDSIILNTATNEKGFFYARVEKGIYKLIFSYIGYDNDTADFKKYSKNTFTGIFKLKKQDNQLEEVLINAGTTELKTDKDIIFITKKLKIGTSDTKDVLNKINGIYYDYHARTITVDGENKVILLVNGLEKNNEYIKNIPSERIKKIEIIRDPDGKYGLLGYSAVINIILKKDYKGTELFIYNNNESDFFKENKAQICAINNFYASINYTENKINIYSLVSNNYKNLYDPTEIKKEFTAAGIVQNNTMIQNNNDYTYKNTTNYYTFGIDYYINPKHTISFESSLNDFPESKDTREEYYRVTKTAGTTLTDEYFTENYTDSRNKYYRNTVFYKYIINSRNTLNADFSYTRYTDDYDKIYNEFNRFESTEQGRNTKDNTIFYLNFYNKISDKSSLRAGYGNINTYIKNTNSFLAKDLIDNSDYKTTDSLTYTDVRHHVYLYFLFKPFKKTSIKIGGTFETDKPEYENISLKRFYAFCPYADFKYKNFKIKYRATSKYPMIIQINPFTEITDKQTFFEGNPELEPFTVHKIYLRSDFFGNKLSIKPYYYFSKNYITKTATLKKDTIVEYSYANVDKFSKTGIKINFTVPFGKSFSLQSVFDIYRSSINDTYIDNSFFDMITSQQLQYFNEKNKFTITLTYQKFMRKYIKGYGYVKANDDFWLITTQKSFLKQKLNITLGYYLPLNFAVDYNQSYYTEIENYIYERTTYIGDVLKNYLMVTVSYKFGKGKKTIKTNKKIKEEKEYKPNE